jgi:hypothetical protein
MDTYKGVVWLRDNKFAGWWCLVCGFNAMMGCRHLFKQEVFEPLCLSVDVKDQRFAPFVEHVIPGRDMTAFVVQNLDDQKLLLAELKDKHGLRRINCVAAPADMPPPMELPRAAQGAGIVSCISDVIEAPLQVKRYICTQVGCFF